MKYMGSKARLAKDILPIILKDKQINQWYVEPFAGGMNSICEVSGNRIANDSNYYLIEMWDKLIKGWIPEEITREQYKNIKQNKDNYPDYIVGWVGFNCSYCGIWFGSFSGKTKTKIGTIRDYQAEAIRNVLKQVKKMGNIILKNQNYYDLELPQNSIIYCDPPYKGTAQYGSKFDHDVFWDWVTYTSKNGHTIFVSEYNAPSNFKCVFEKKMKSSLPTNGKTGGNKISTEKLFKYIK